MLHAAHYRHSNGTACTHHNMKNLPYHVRSATSILPCHWCWAPVLCLGSCMLGRYTQAAHCCCTQCHQPWLLCCNAWVPCLVFLPCSYAHAWGHVGSTMTSKLLTLTTWPAHEHMTWTLPMGAACSTRLSQPSLHMWAWWLYPSTVESWPGSSISPTCCTCGYCCTYRDAPCFCPFSFAMCLHPSAGLLLVLQAAVME